MFDPEFVAPIGFFLVIGWIVKIVLDYRIKQKLIEKGLLDEKVKFLYRGNVALSNLKWGMVLIGIGFAIVLRQWFPYSLSDDGMLGLIFLLAGLSFLVYYFLASKIEKKDRENPDN